MKISFAFCFLGACEVGVKLTDTPAEDNNFTTKGDSLPPLPLLPDIPRQTRHPPKPSPRALDLVPEHETEETKKLSTVQLQRLVLLEQLQLIRMQKEKLSKENNNINSSVITDEGSSYFNL